MRDSFRFPFLGFRLPAVLLLVFASAVPMDAQPRSVSRDSSAARSTLRSHWFDLQNALLEGDVPAARAALDALTRAARARDVRRLADFSRMAAHEGRKAERAGRLGSAWLGYEAAVTLDDSSFDAAASRVGFLIRRSRPLDAASQIPEALSTFGRSAEARLSLASSAAAALILGLVATALAFSVALLLRHFRRIFHDLHETAGRPFGASVGAPLAFAVLLLPVFFAFGPTWLVLYWIVLSFAYATRRERIVLAVLLVLLGVVPVAVDAIARENLRARSPIRMAAVDLEERREDASVEDGLAAYAVSRPEEPEVWFLLGRYAERSGDRPRAVAAYGHAIAADPEDHRSYVNRGNVRFAEGDYPAAIGDYEEATRRAPDAVEAFYNLSVARSEIYDFKGQERARAAALRISPRDVDTWSSRPPLARVVPAKVRPRGMRPTDRVAPDRDAVAPRRASAAVIPAALLTPATLAPWSALAAGFLLAVIRSRKGVAAECARCSRAFCRRCKRQGGPAVLCASCVKLARGGPNEEELREQDRRETRSRASRRRWATRLATLAIPGIHRLSSGRPWLAAAGLFVFFFAIAVAVGGPWFFEVRPLAPPEAALPGRVAALAVALVLWLFALVGAWRLTRES